jgi:hypothetical protein
VSVGMRAARIRSSDPGHITPVVRRWWHNPRHAL